MSTMDRVWLYALDDILDHGVFTSPRGKKTLELMAHTIAVDMRWPVLTIKERKLGYRFMAAEAAWILSGDNSVAVMKPYSRIIQDFSDDGKTFFGAYGPKIINQLAYVANTLSADMASRQAVINIWRENPPKSKDIPCTLSVQFMIRSNRLNAYVTMRSSDIWLGVPYDIFNFTMLSAAVLLHLKNSNLELGYLYNTAGSRHFYMENMEAAKAVLDGAREPGYAPAQFNWHEFKSMESLTQHLWDFANNKSDMDEYKWLMSQER